MRNARGVYGEVMIEVICEQFHTAAIMPPIEVLSSDGISHTV